MDERQEQFRKDFRAFFGGSPCGEMMRKLIEGEKERQNFPCAEIISQMMPLCREFMGKGAEPVEKKKETPGRDQ